MPDAARKVFISYSHDSKKHSARVLELANRLRHDGVDAIIDQYELAPEMGWPRWMEQQVQAADFVIIVASPTYKRRFEGTEHPGGGRGVSWEGLILTQTLYESSGKNRRIIPVVFSGVDLEASIPLPLRAFLFLRIPEDYESLLRHIYDKPAIVRPPLGPAPRLEPKSVGSVASGELRPSVEVRINADSDEARRQITELQKALREAVGSDDIYITDIKPGSSRLQVSGDSRAIAKLEQLIKENAISDLLGLKVDRLDRLDSSTQASGPPWLDQAVLNKVFRAAEALGLAEVDLRVTLLSGLSRSIQSQIPKAADGPPQLLSDLRYLNGLSRLADGSAPIHTWLETAELLKSDFQDSAVFTQALQSLGAL